VRELLEHVALGPTPTSPVYGRSSDRIRKSRRATAVAPEASGVGDRQLDAHAAGSAHGVPWMSLPVIGIE
jgi:hypothetical protein